MNSAIVFRGAFYLEGSLEGSLEGWGVLFILGEIIGYGCTPRQFLGTATALDTRRTLCEAVGDVWWSYGM